MNLLRLFGIRGSPKPKSTDWKGELVKELAAWRARGQKFEYCGRTMVVTGYWDYIPDSMGGYTRVGIEADYADDHGVIHSVRFDAQESRALMESQP